MQQNSKEPTSAEVLANAPNPEPVQFPSYTDFGIDVDPEDDTLDAVEIDGIVVLKIVKHCQENLPDYVTGQLLGLDTSENLEVTNCFPFPTNSRDEEESPNTGAEYQIEMMRCLREVNIDHYTVGWYQSTYLGSFLNESVIETQYNYQVTIPKCVVLIYDPLKTSQGSLALKGYRLTKEFMGLYKNGIFQKDKLNSSNFSFNNIFEEVPLHIRNNYMITALLKQLSSEKSMEYDYESFDLTTNPFLEKNVEFLIECIDDLGNEQHKLQYYQKLLGRQQAIIAQKKKDGEELGPQKNIHPPSKLDSLLITNSINNYCEQINGFASNSFTKLFMFGKNS